MPIPDYESCMLPLLQLASDKRDHSIGEAREHLAPIFGVTDEEREQLLPSGKARLYDNRVAWAKTYLQHAGLLEPTERGCFKLTPRGRSVLEGNPSHLSSKYLDRFPEFLEFKKKTRGTKKEMPHVIRISHSGEGQTPEESLEDAYFTIKRELAEQLLARVKTCSPAFFEKLVIELLLKMGYGGSRKDAGEAIGRSGDGGIDGIIKEDRLGLDIVYVQAKRWDGTVSRPEIQKFVGALQGQRARKGVFITTGSFSNEAQEYVSRIDCRIILIDGDALTQYMIDYDIGVSIVSAYEIKRIDSDYFSDD